MKDRISDLKAWLYRRQLWIERKPSVHLFIIFVYALLFMTLTIYGFFLIINPAIKAVCFLGILLLLSSLIAADYLHVKVIKRNRFELDERKRLIGELVSVEKNIYKVKYRRDLFDIEPDGDMTYRREMSLEYADVDVPWAEILFGTTNEFGTDFDRMIVNAYTYPDTAHPLSRVPIENTQARMRFAIILRSKLTKIHRSEGFQITMKWLRGWRALMESCKDDAVLRIEHDTAECVLEIILPTGYSFVDFRMPRTDAEPQYGITDAGRSFVQYRLKDLVKGEIFNYFVEIKKGDA